MYTFGLLIVSGFVAFFVLMIYDVAQPTPDGVHKFGPIYWVAKRHHWFIESGCDNVVHKTFLSISTEHVDLGSGDYSSKMLCFHFLFWSLYFGIE